MGYALLAAVLVGSAIAWWKKRPKVIIKEGAAPTYKVEERPKVTIEEPSTSYKVEKVGNVIKNDLSELYKKPEDENAYALIKKGVEVIIVGVKDWLMLRVPKGTQLIETERAAGAPLLSRKRFQSMVSFGQKRAM